MREVLWQQEEHVCGLSALSIAKGQIQLELAAKSRPRKGGFLAAPQMGSDPFVGSGGDGFGDFVEDFGPVFSGAGGGGLPVEGVAGDEGQGEGGFGVDHLLGGEADLAPGAGLSEGGT